MQFILIRINKKKETGKQIITLNIILVQMYIMKQLLLLILLALTAMPTDAQEYPKVILPGDYPDPSIMREGEDYYMTHSPFFYTPGFLIWHSKDLVNWEPVCRACPEY